MSKLFQLRWIGLCAVTACCLMYINLSFIINRSFRAAITSGLCPALGFLGLYIGSGFKEEQWAYHYLNFGRILSLLCLRIFSVLHHGDNLMKTCITTAGLLPWVSKRIYWLATPNERSFGVWPWTKSAYKMLNFLRLVVLYLVYQIYKGRHSMTDTFFLEKILLAEILLALIPFVIRLDDMFSLDYLCEVGSVFCAIWTLRDLK